MALYEAVVMLEPYLTDEDNQKLQEKLKGVIAANGGEILQTDLWGRRRLAYKIKKKNESYYIIHYVKAEPTGPLLKELDRFCRLNESVMRHMIVRRPTDKLTVKVEVPAPVEGAAEVAPAAVPAIAEEPTATAPTSEQV